MHTAPLYRIECADGLSATLYLPALVREEHLQAIGAALAAIPATVRTLRVQLGGLVLSSHLTPDPSGHGVSVPGALLFGDAHWVGDARVATEAVGHAAHTAAYL